MKILSLETWTERAKAHQGLVGPIADAFLQRRGAAQKHPVYDFLFTYYTFSPAKLKRWVPSFEEALSADEGGDLSCFDEYWFKLGCDRPVTISLKPHYFPQLISC